MPVSAASAPLKDCTPKPRGARPPVSLDILATDHHPRGVEGIRRSRSGPRRAIVLIIIQLLIIAHIALWLISKETGWLAGRTTTPIEPSESMEFAKHGIVNAGLIFFCLALLSTLIFGRWFCGWGCHIVMLQDFCSWIMKQCGIRPKPFRSRLLMWVPLLLALYMFIWPVAYRLGMWAGDEMGFGWAQSQLIPWELSASEATLTTTEFWRTFPGVMVAIPFLLICGFATVYFLGAKGFCTYGCPYGGFFAPLDRVAPGRILVTDACEGCGHCTAVCTSNVRVHEEVRDFGMVVDQGCMKCMDCVSVCPKEALYFGFAMPPGLGGVRPAGSRSRSAAGEGGGARRTKSPRSSWLSRWKSRPRGRLKFDFSWPEEIALALLFAGCFFAMRGSVNGLPLLFAAGTAGVTTFLAWKLGRVVRDENAHLHRFRLKWRGELQRSGVIFAGVTTMALGMTALNGAAGIVRVLAAREDARVTIPLQTVYSPSPFELPAEMLTHAERAIELYQQSSSVADGGIGLFTPTETTLRLAWLLSCTHEFTAAESLLRDLISRRGDHEQASRYLGLILRTLMRDEEAVDFYREVVRVQPKFLTVRDELSIWLEESGQIDEAIQVSREALALNDLSEDHWLYWMRRVSILEVKHGDAQVGIELIQRTLEIAPGNPSAYFYLALGYGRLQQPEQAVEALKEALRLSPNEPRFNTVLAELLTELGRTEEAKPYAEAARRLASP